jgi:hypothetical protein
MMVAMVVMSESLEKRPGATPAAFPLPSFAGTASVSVFRVSPPPPRGNALGVLYIVIFRSNWAVWDEDGWHRRFEAQTSKDGAAWLGAAPPVLFCASWTPCWLLVLQKVLMININAWKISGQIEFRKVFETSKYTKQGFLVLLIYNQNKGVDGKSP